MFTYYLLTYFTYYGSRKKAHGKKAPRNLNPNQTLTLSGGLFPVAYFREAFFGGEFFPDTVILESEPRFTIEISMGMKTGVISSTL